MLLVNVPQVAAWILLCTARSMTAIYLAAIMMGFSCGFLEAPSFSYVGEVSVSTTITTLSDFFIPEASQLPLLIIARYLPARKTQLNHHSIPRNVGGPMEPSEPGDLAFRLIGGTEHPKSQ